MKPTHRLPILMLMFTAAACSGRHDPHGGGDPAGAASDPSRGAAEATTLTIRGSDTMVILAQRWAEAYMAEHEGTTLQVSGGGSGTGIAALINGTADIATASREMKERERVQIRDRQGASAHGTRVALDAVAVYVRSDNPVPSLSVVQLSQIFRGQVSDWSAVGGGAMPMVLYSRENNSGTYAYFKERVLDDLDFAQSAQTLPGTSAVIHAVSRDPGGIGYGGIAYAEGVRAVRIAAEDGTPVEPTMANVLGGAYPLSRHLRLYTVGEPSGLAADFIAFALSEAGQSIVDGVGYYPLPPTDAPGTMGEAGAPSDASGATAAAGPATSAAAQTASATGAVPALTAE